MREIVRETSVEAYKGIVADGSLHNFKEVVFKLFKKHGPATSNQIMKVFQEQNPQAPQQLVESISRRASDLTKEGRLKVLSKVVCPVTNHHCFLRKATDEDPIILTKAEKIQNQINKTQKRLHKLLKQRDELINSNKKQYKRRTASRLKTLTHSLLYLHGPCTANELTEYFKHNNSNATHQTAETISKTLCQLRDDGSVIELPNVKCSITGRTVIQWAISGVKPRTLTKLEQLDLRIKKAKACLLSYRSKLMEIDSV